jgi:acetyl-CoA acetyltransferase
VLGSALVSDPLRLYEICPVSDGAAAAVICSAEKARQLASSPIWVAGSAVATARFDDGLPRGLAGMVPPGKSYHSEAALAVSKALEQAGAAPEDLDFVELQDNTVYYELAFPEDWGLCKPGEAEHLLERGETLPTGKLPINPSGGFLSFGEPGSCAVRRAPGRCPARSSASGRPSAWAATEPPSSSSASPHISPGSRLLGS